MTSAGLYDVIGRRRDVRAEFTGAPIDPEALDRILGAAHTAPSVGMSQPWDFVLVRDERTRKTFHAHVLGERRAFQDSLDGERAQTFTTIKIEGILESTVGIVVTYDPTRAGPAVLGRHTNPDAGLYSVCLAIENLWLAATAEGLGVGWVSFFREPFLRELLGIPATIRPIAWLCVGPVTSLQATPDLERHGWRSPAPLSSVVHYEHYDSARA
ncbi:MAG: 5,6-dimethylbenzimidazole synthase [Mycobacterium sp.]